ncbi:MAG: hypothetical protein F4Z25_07150 [Chloroflexi bacterium]|nr:hypothetical protein [Chloroflexota bacterium]
MTATMQTRLPEALAEPGAGERLREARALIADRARWMMGSEACSADGTYIRASSPDAVAWCGLGAYRRVGGDRYDAVHNYLDAIARELFAEARTSDPDTLGGLVLVNDWLCWDEWFDDFEDPLAEAHERVLHVFDVAIERFERAW